MNSIKKLTIGLALVLLSASGSVMVPAGQASAAARCTDYMYGYGGNGTCVRYLQQMLNAAGANWAEASYYGTCYGRSVSMEVLATDGSFGGRTDAKVRSFQNAYCLGTDGLVGQKTWAKLCQRISGWYTNTSYPGASMYNQGHNAGYYAGCSKYGYFALR